jgi:hypothetical protein
LCLKFYCLGFQVIIDRINKKVLISFDSKKVAEKHHHWLIKVDKNIGLQQLTPQPYWGFDDLEHKAGTKLLNCFYVQAEIKKEAGEEFYRYTQIMMLQKFNFNNFLEQIESGNILIDFDARTGHNHGTKFRIKQSCLTDLYESKTIIK